MPVFPVYCTYFVDYMCVSSATSVCKYGVWPSKTRNQISSDNLLSPKTLGSDCHCESCLSIILSHCQPCTFSFHGHAMLPPTKVCAHMLTRIGTMKGTKTHKHNPRPQIHIPCGTCDRGLLRNGVHESLFMIITFCPSLFPSLSPYLSCLSIRARSSLSTNQKSPPLPPPKTPNQEVPPPLGLPARRLTPKHRPCPQRAKPTGPSSTP